MSVLPIPQKIRSLIIQQLSVMMQADYVPEEPLLGICYNLHDALSARGVGEWAYDVVAVYSVDWPGNNGRVALTPRDYHAGFPQWSCYPIARSYVGGDRTPLWEGDQLIARRSLMLYLHDRLQQDAAAA